MNVSAIDMTSLAARPVAAPLRDDGDFGAALDAARQPTARAFLDIEGPPARAIARHLVSTAFVLPALESMRSTSFRGELFAPGTAEKRFGPMLDRQIADRLASAPGFPLVDAIERHVTALAARRSPA